jgi:hypothetical protein
LEINLGNYQVSIIVTVVNKDMRALFLPLILLLLFSCSKSDDKSCSCSDAPCTDQFVSIVVKIIDKSGNPVSLDYYRTYKALSGYEIDIQSKKSSWEDSIGKARGSYVVVNDAQSEIIDVCGELFMFIGKKDGKIIVKENYVIRNDCCHVNLVSGKREVIID